MRKQKIKKAAKNYLNYEEDMCDSVSCPYNCDPGCLDYEEKLLTNFKNLDKIKRKENKW